MQVVGPNLDKSTQCEAVLRSLPGWFGIETSILRYAEETNRLPTFAIEEDSQLVAFITLKKHFAGAWEITCIAVHARSRGRGLGRQLIEFAEQWLRDQNALFLQVKTIAPTKPNAEYAQTRAFYKALGFEPIEVFPELWSPSHPCLQMIKRIECKA
jgi:GNAT superfamily N-acetyltransferase